MRIRFALAAVVLGAALFIANAGDNKASVKGKTTMIAGIKWETSLAAAQKRAEKEGKPILLMHLFGRLDDEFC